MTGSFITCDHDDCDQMFRWHSGDSWRIRGAAQDHGWTTSDDGDYCPTHTQLEDDLEVAA